MVNHPAALVKVWFQSWLTALLPLRGPTWSYRTNTFAPPGYSLSLKDNCLHLRDGVPSGAVLS